ADSIRKKRKKHEAELKDVLVRLRRKPLALGWSNAVVSQAQGESRNDGSGPGQWIAGESIAANAARTLPVLASDWLAKGQAAISQSGSQTDDFRSLHRFRLRTKSFRYTLELFEAVYGQEMEKGLRTVQALQTRLGRINDFVTTLDLAKGHKSLEDAL